ncbi:DUF2723 domain-containing protein [bacterium]|nr:MAG: DUF2723 domain-containing protein [bacterium]
MHDSVAASGADLPTKSRDSIRGPFFSSPFFLVFVLSLGLYLFLLPPSIARGGDCGELIAASYNLGIAHPSGYPIWSLLGRIFALLPFGEIAWRYNFFSAFCAALAAAIMATTAQGILKTPSETTKIQAKWSASGAGLLLAGFFFFGSQALLAEVYALAALEGAALLFFAARWKSEGDWRDFYTLAWLAGLSPLIHLSGVFLWPFLGVWALWKQKGLTIGRFAIALALWGSGLLFALYFPIRSGHFPAPPSAALDSYFYFPLDWGHPTTLAALKNHLTAAQYSSLLKPRPLPDLLENATQLGKFLLFQYLWATPLLLWGALRAFRHGLGWILAAIFVINIVVEIQYDVSDQSNFFFPAYLVMSLWMALGWFSFLEWMEKRGQKLARGDINSLWPWRLHTFGKMLLISTVAAQWLLFSASANQSGTIRPRDGAIEAARAAQQLAKIEGKPVAALYVHDDTLWPFWYAKYALGLAPDVETPWGRGLGKVTKSGQLWRYVAQLKKKGPVVMAQWDEKTDERFPLVMLTPSGNLCVASDRQTPPEATLWTAPVKAPTPGPNGLLAARFRRAKLWRDQGSTPAFSPASMAAYEVDFRVGGKTPERIEVLLAYEDELKAKKPAPTQDTVAQGSAETGRILISRQSRRLVLPGSAKPGQTLRAAVPLQIEATSPVGKYKIWTRLLNSAQDGKQTPWTLTDEIRLTAK